MYERGCPEGLRAFSRPLPPGIRGMRGMKAALAALASAFLLWSCAGASKGTVRVFNWGDYIDEGILEDFTGETGIRIVYDTFSQNEDMYVKLKMGADSYDVVFPSDYMIKRLIKEGIAGPIDMGKVPNYRFISERFKNAPWDPNNEYSVPYMWGTVGIAYDATRVVPAPESWEALWDPAWKGEIFMMESQRDSIGIALKKLGFSLNTRDPGELNAAREELILQKPLVLAYVGDEVKDKMIGGEAAMAVVYSGDAVYMAGENPDIAYVVPKEGSNIWYDGMIVPKASKNLEAAYAFIDYLCRPDVAARNALYIGYSTPNEEAFKGLPPEARENPAAYPGDEILERCEFYDDLSDALGDYDRVWLEVKAAR